MHLTNGSPYWLINDGLISHYPKLMGARKTSVAIIGGGISGALMAMQLTRAGIPCILVDRRSIGLGSTCASTSLLQYELDIPLHRLIRKTGRDSAVRSYQLCGEALQSLLNIMRDTRFTDFEINPSLLFSVHRRENKTMQRELLARREAGFEVELLGKKEMETSYGLQARFGILSQLGASVNAYRLTHHLLRYCMDKGLEVYDRTRVVSIESDMVGVQLTTETGKITADYAVHASGYEVVEFIGKKIVSFDFTYAIASEHQAEQNQLWKERTLLWNTDDPYLYMRLTTDNRLLAGGGDLPFSRKAASQETLDAKARMLEKDLGKFMPGLRFRTEFAWSGLFGSTKDSLPYIGALPGNPRVLYALGFGGNGITFAQIAAEMLADHIRGINNRDSAIFRFDR